MITLPAPARGATLWPAVASAVATDAAGRGVALRDVVVLLPFAALIDPLRAAFAARAGWQPRVETVRTMAASLGPADEPEPGQCSGEPALDRLQAAHGLPSLPAAERDHAAALLAEAAAALVDAAAAQPPHRRATWWAHVAAQLPGMDGPGGTEAALLRAAVAWASQAPAPATDRLFSGDGTAWYGVHIGGQDPLVAALLDSCGGVAVDLDPAGDDPFHPFVADASVHFVEAADFESEAWKAAQAVLELLARRTGRVALVALDRALVRRASALLRRAGVAVDDETGWKLSTHAAAGQVLARLRAAAERATPDERLDWLKRWPPAQVRPGGQRALQALEASWRAGRNARLRDDERVAAQALWADAQAVLATWQQPAERPLGAWLDLLTRQLDSDGESAVLAADPAGQQLLRLLQRPQTAVAWRTELSATRMDLVSFTAWFEGWCESTPVDTRGATRPRVVLTPLARALGRPFDGVVVAGADARRLGPIEPDARLLGDVVAARIGLPAGDERRRRRRLALAQLLRQDELVLMWRRSDADALLGPGDDLQALLDAGRRGGRAWAVEQGPPQSMAVDTAPVYPPLPRVQDRLPLWLSASRIEALRDCPYRFYVRSVLRLFEDEEIEREADKRDWGDWLHLTLHRFHADRQAGQDDTQALHAAAAVAAAELGLDQAEMLPFQATLGRVIDQYVQWLHPREAAGWRWMDGEREYRAAPAGWAPQQLRGRLDRVDQGPGGVLEVIDYKTTRADTLRQRVRLPLEDTQLAFYAALLAAADERAAGGVRAAYLAIDEADGPEHVTHPGVQDSAAVLLDRLGDELRRMRDGEPLAALGQGALCDRCEARGLCRRDQWAEPATPARPDVAHQGLP